MQICAKNSLENFYAKGLKYFYFVDSRKFELFSCFLESLIWRKMFGSQFYWTKVFQKDETCVEINECDPNPCVNPSLCTDLVNDYGCGVINDDGNFVCNYGWQGKNCDEPFDFCASDP